MKRSIALILASLPLVACMGPALKQQMIRATASPNPMTEGRLTSTPIATTREGALLRIITADEKEVCINGELGGEPEAVSGYAFKMESFATLDDDEAKVKASKSKSVKVLGSYKRLGRGGPEPITQFQTCFDNGGVFTAQTAYLVIQRDPQPTLGLPMTAVWHFDDSIRQMHAMR